MLNDKLKRLMFNGRTLNGEFRRGFWKAKELDGVKGAPVLPGLAGLYANGGWQWVINKTQDVINNTGDVLVARVAPNANAYALDALKAVYPDVVTDYDNPLDVVKITKATIHNTDYFMDL